MQSNAMRCHRGMVAAVALVTAAMPLRVSYADETSRPRRPLNLFEGRVLDHEGEPVASAGVAVAHAESGFISYWSSMNVHTYGLDEKFLFFFTKRNGAASGKVMTDESGRFRIRGLQAGKYNLMAVHPERGMVILCDVEQPNAGNLLEVVLQPPTFVAGQIRGLEHTEEWQSAWLDYQAAWPWPEKDEEDADGWTRIYVRPGVDIDDEGRFRFGPLPIAGPWALNVSRYVEKQGYRATLLTLPVTVELGTTAELNVDLDTGAQVGGRVIGPDSEPLSGASVTATVTVGERVTTYGTITEKDGRYTIRGLPAGEYKLEAIRRVPRTGPG